MTQWEILNANNFRWGRETYPTREAAETELKTFWRGVHGVNLKKFTIREVPPTLIGEPVEHRASPANRKADEPTVHEAIVSAHVTAAEVAYFQPDAIDRGGVIEASKQGSLDLGHAVILAPISRKVVSENGQVLSEVEQ